MKELKKGISLVEIIIYSMVLSFVLLVVANLLILLLSFWQNNQIQKSLIRNEAFINAKINKDISESYQVNIPTDYQFSQEMILISSASGEIRYAISDQRLYRNTAELSDNNVIISLEGDDLGFRLLGHSIDWRYKVVSQVIPISGRVREKLVKGTAFLSNVYE